MLDGVAGEAVVVRVQDAAEDGAPGAGRGEDGEAADGRGRFLMSDDPYGTLNPIPWLDRTFSVPDLAIGRLVETDAEIQKVVAKFTDYGRLG